VVAGALTGLSNGGEGSPKIVAVSGGHMSRRHLTVQIMSTDRRKWEAADDRDTASRTVRRVPELSLASRADRHSLSSQGEVLEAELGTAELNGREPMRQEKVVRTGRSDQPQLDQRREPHGAKQRMAPLVREHQRGAIQTTSALRAALYDSPGDQSVDDFTPNDTEDTDRERDTVSNRWDAALAAWVRRHPSRMWSDELKGNVVYLIQRDFERRHPSAS